MCNYRLFLVCLFINVACGGQGIAQRDFSVLSYWKYYSDAENTLYKMQYNISAQKLRERKEVIENIDTKGDWEKRQSEIRKVLDKIAGPFPEKTPLNAVITGTIQRDGYIVEKLYFESMPGYKVTAAFFIPAGKKQDLPAIIYCSGHSDLSFRSDVYQHVIINLVKKGFTVFAFDPVGQGERQQYYDVKSGKSRFGSTHEHSYPGAQLFINGASVARYMIWDGIRSVDYLLTRQEIDPDRIGITGRSGGGTQSSYIAAFDDRIKVSAPECYLTTLEYLLKSQGPQDAEQNFFHGIAEGFDLPDLLQVRAPKPTLMITTTRDIFSIQGARETFLETQKAYEAYGESGNLEMVEDDAAHESTKYNREAMYAFFQKHLNNPGASEDIEVELFSVEDLYVTETGQLSTSIGSRFLFDVNKSLSDANHQHLEAQREDMKKHLNMVGERVVSISGFDPDADPGKLVFSGREQFEGYTLEKYILEFDSEFAIPVDIFLPQVSAEKAVLYLDDLNDKNSEKSYEIPINLVKDGLNVIAPDLPGYGELGPGYLKGDAYFNNTSYNQWFAGILNGKSMVAIHAEVIKSVLYHSKKALNTASWHLTGMSRGPFNSSLLHAAGFGVDFDNLVLLNPILSFSSIVVNRDYEPSFIPFTVAGGLGYYDLPDLVALLAPAKITIIDGLDHSGNVADSLTVQSDYDLVKDHYESMNSGNNFTIITENDRTTPFETVLRIIRE